MGAELHMEAGAGEEQELREWPGRLQKDGEFLYLSGQQESGGHLQQSICSPAEHILNRKEYLSLIFAQWI